MLFHGEMSMFFPSVLDDSASVTEAMKVEWASLSLPLGVGPERTGWPLTLVLP